MVKSILHTLDKSIAPTTDELLELTDYLFKIENWDTTKLLYSKA